LPRTLRRKLSEAEHKLKGHITGIETISASVLEAISSGSNHFPEARNINDFARGDLARQRKTNHGVARVVPGSARFEKRVSHPDIRVCSGIIVEHAPFIVRAVAPEPGGKVFAKIALRQVPI